MSSWRLARVLGAVATVGICFSAFAHAHAPRGSGTGLAKDHLRPVARHVKALESLDDSQGARAGSGRAWAYQMRGAVGPNASVYAKPEGASLDLYGFDKLKPEELAEDRAAGLHILTMAGEDVTIRYLDGLFEFLGPESNAKETD